MTNHNREWLAPAISALVRSCTSAVRVHDCARVPVTTAAMVARQWRAAKLLRSEFNYKPKSSDLLESGSNRLIKQLPNSNRSPLINRAGQERPDWYGGTGLICKHRVQPGPIVLWCHLLCRQCPLVLITHRLGPASKQCADEPNWKTLCQQAGLIGRPMHYDIDIIINNCAVPSH